MSAEVPSSRPTTASAMPHRMPTEHAAVSAHRRSFLLSAGSALMLGTLPEMGLAQRKDENGPENAKDEPALPLHFSKEKGSYAELPNVAQALLHHTLFRRCLIEARVTPAKVTAEEATIFGNHERGNGIFLRMKDGKYQFGVGTGNAQFMAVSDERAEEGVPAELAGAFIGEHLMLFVNGKLQRIAPAVEQWSPRAAICMLGADPKAQADLPDHHWNGTIESLCISAAHYDRVRRRIGRGQGRSLDPDFIRAQELIRYRFGGAGEGGKRRTLLRNVANIQNAGLFDGIIHHAEWEEPKEPGE